METESSNNEALVLGFSNQKGGVGKSTLTHLTAKTLGLAPIGKKVLVIEIDAQGTLNKIRTKQELARPGFIFPYDLVSCKLEDLQKHITVENGSKYDFIFIDMPGTLDKVGIAEMLITADILYIPLSPSEYDTDSTVDFIKTAFHVKQRRKAMGFPFNYYTIINRMKAGTKAGRELADALEEGKINLLDSTITDYEFYKDHSANFEPLIGPNMKQKPSLEFEKFISSLLKTFDEFRLIESVSKIVDQNIK